MKVNIYAFTHKEFDVPPDKMYVPMQVGCALNENLGYLRDDEGENISALNCYYSELTGMYWLWKHEHESDIIGTCHYRRFLIDTDEVVLTKDKIINILEEYDLITTKPVHLNNSYHYGFSANHNIRALDITGEVIKDLYPDYYDIFIELVNEPDTYFGNMIICRHQLYDEYCQWLFTIFDEVRNRIDLNTDEDDYHKRVLGFISEFLLYVFVINNKLKAFHCKVGMFGEKMETREMKMTLQTLFEKRDIAGAHNFFVESLKKRPDVMMEASDITGELRMAMQVVATCEQELKECDKCILDYENDFRKLMDIIAKLNNIVSNHLHEDYKTSEKISEEDKEFMKEKYISVPMVRVAEMLFEKR